MIAAIPTHQKHFLDIENIVCPPKVRGRTSLQVPRGAHCELLPEQSTTPPPHLLIEIPVLIEIPASEKRTPPKTIGI
jgi:hypothetical protein